MGNVREWARLGASRRIAEISAELAEIHKAFPELRGSRRGAEVTATQPGRRGRRSMSATEKAEVSRRMKAYWARRRKATASARR
jgi:hypothetical protein